MSVCIEASHQASASASQSATAACLSLSRPGAAAVEHRADVVLAHLVGRDRRGSRPASSGRPSGPASCGRRCRGSAASWAASCGNARGAGAARPRRGGGAGRRRAPAGRGEQRRARRAARSRDGHAVSLVFAAGWNRFQPRMATVGARAAPLGQLPMPRRTARALCGRTPAHVRARLPLKSCSVNELANHFLEIYADGGEADKGWLYGKALQQARLDFTPDSLRPPGRLARADPRARAAHARPARLAAGPQLRGAGRVLRDRDRRAACTHADTRLA